MRVVPWVILAAVILAHPPKTGGDRGIGQAPPPPWAISWRRDLIPKLRGGRGEEEAGGGGKAEEEDYEWHSEALWMVPPGELEGLSRALGLPTRNRSAQQLVHNLLTRVSPSEKGFLSEALLELLPGYAPGGKPKVQHPQEAARDEGAVSGAQAGAKGSKLRSGFFKGEGEGALAAAGTKRGRPTRLVQDAGASGGSRMEVVDGVPTLTIGEEAQDEDFYARFEGAWDGGGDGDVGAGGGAEDERSSGGGAGDFEDDASGGVVLARGRGRKPPPPSKPQKKPRVGEGEEGVVVTEEMERRLAAEQAASVRSGKTNKYCQHPRGCVRFPVYGLFWDRIPRFCIEHRHDHHLDVRHAPRNVYMGLDPSGERVTELENIKVVEDPDDPEDNLRVQRALEPYFECKKCGCDGAPVDVYYEYPFLVKRLSTRRIQREVWKDTVGTSEPESEEMWVFNQTFDSIPPGPHAGDGDEEWRRFEGTEQGGVRTNKDVEEANWIQERWAEEVPPAPPPPSSKRSSSTRASRSSRRGWTAS